MSDPLSAITNTSKTDSQKSITKLSDNFDSFLTLLTTQLKNQDPLSPVETTEFTNQLVQFASVEQLIKQNEHLETLIDNQELDRNVRAAGYVGYRVEHSTSVFDLRNGYSQIAYTLPEKAGSVKIEIANENRVIVKTMEGATEAATHRLTWTGVDNEGNQLNDGLYQVRVTAIDADGRRKPVVTRAYGTVTSVDISGSEPRLVVFGKKVGFSDISGITYEAPSAAASQGSSGQEGSGEETAEESGEETPGESGEGAA